MPSLSYKGRFVEYVEEGLKPNPKGRVKRQSIRNLRKRLFKKGDTLYHFYGMRTKWCRRLGQSVCEQADLIEIKAKVILIGSLNERGRVAVHKIITNTDQLNEFAYADGFESWSDMVRWWKITHGSKCFPFRGQLIKW